MASPAVLAGTSLASTALGGATSAFGNLMGGNAKAAMYNYQAGVAQVNAQIAKQNAEYATAVGEVEAQQSGLRTRFQMGATKAGQGASGLAVGQGSSAAVVESEAAIGTEDQALIRSNAAKKAYGFEVEAMNQTAQSQLDTMAAQDAKEEGELKAFSSILGTAGSVSSGWLKASQAGIF